MIKNSDGSEAYNEDSEYCPKNFEGSKVYKDNITDYTKSLWGKIFYGQKKAKGNYSPIIILQKKMHKDVDLQSNPRTKKRQNKPS